MIDHPKLYHLVPPKVEGEFLMPVNQLKNTFPDLAAQHAGKYVGREQLISQRIPHLNGNWLDVLQLSPVHPEQIKNALLEVGFGWRPMLFFEIDSGKAGMNGSNAVIFKNLKKPEGDFAPRPEEFVPFSDQLAFAHAELPAETRQHFAEARAQSVAPMVFLWVPHVLFNGQIPVNNLKIIEI